jgi:hypothetical protein
MKLSMAITLDGLVRALRWKEHDLAERAARTLAVPGIRTEADQPAPRSGAPASQARITDDDGSDR